jgi:hypothetical protein
MYYAVENNMTQLHEKNEPKYKQQITIRVLGSILDMYYLKRNGLDAFVTDDIHETV